LKPITLEWAEKAEADLTTAKREELALPYHPEPGQLREALAALADFAVAFRYPGERATAGMARDALHHASRVRAMARELLRSWRQG
jgi:hypothetical protein